MAPLVLKATFRHIDQDRVTYITDVDAEAIMLRWQAMMEAFVRRGYRTLTCVCEWITL